jgi:hypothetical protein
MTILRASNLSQIHQTIVGPVSVDVIDFGRPPPKKDEPNDAMSAVCFSLKCHLNVSAAMFEGDTASDAPLFPPSLLKLPKKEPGLRAVPEFFAGDLWRHFHFSNPPHDQPDSEREQTPDREIEKQREAERFIETRLREIERFERRLRLGQRSRRKRMD